MTLRGSLYSPLRMRPRGGRWSTFEQYHQLAERSLRTALSVVADDLPGVSQVCVFAFSRDVVLFWFCYNQ